MQRTLKLIAWGAVLFTGVNFIPYTSTYAYEPLKDNRYYCERLDDYHMTQENEITKYCNELLKHD